MCRDLRGFKLNFAHCACYTLYDYDDGGFTFGKNRLDAVAAALRRFGTVLQKQCAVYPSTAHYQMGVIESQTCIIYPGFQILKFGTAIQK